MARFSGWRALAVLVLACCSSLGPSPALADDAGEPPAVPGDRKPVRDVLRGVRTLSSDTWFVFSSPARLNRNGAAWLAGTALVTAVVYTNDEAISRAFQRQHGNPVFDAALKIGNNIEPVGYMGRMMPYYVGTLGLGYAFGNRPLTVIPGQVIEAHLIAGGVRNLSKLLIGRRRPFEDEGPRSFEFAGGTSFPSGHTSVAFEIATILSLHAKRWPVTAATYTLATTIAMQRVDSGGHWPSDVLVPAVTGSFIARTIVRRHEERVWAIVPSFTPGGGTGLQLVVAF